MALLRTRGGGLLATGPDAVRANAMRQQQRLLGAARSPNVIRAPMTVINEENPLNTFGSGLGQLGKTLSDMALNKRETEARKALTAAAGDAQSLFRVGQSFPDTTAGKQAFALSKNLIDQQIAVSNAETARLRAQNASKSRTLKPTEEQRFAELATNPNRTPAEEIEYTALYSKLLRIRLGQIGDDVRAIPTGRLTGVPLPKAMQGGSTGSPGSGVIGPTPKAQAAAAAKTSLSESVDEIKKRIAEIPNEVLGKAGGLTALVTDLAGTAKDFGKRFDSAALSELAERAKGVVSDEKTVEGLRALPALQKLFEDAYVQSIKAAGGRAPNKAQIERFLSRIDFTQLGDPADIKKQLNDLAESLRPRTTSQGGMKVGQSITTKSGITITKTSD